MAHDTKPILRDVANQPIPQVYDQSTDSYQPARGTDGRQHVLAHNPDGSVADFRLASTEATLLALSGKIDTLQSEIENVKTAITDQAKGTDVDPVVSQLSGSNQADDTQTEADAIGGVHTFTANVTTIVIANEDTNNRLTATVNGVTIKVPPFTSYGPVTIVGTPSNQVTVSGSAKYMLSRRA